MVLGIVGNKLDNTIFFNIGVSCPSSLLMAEIKEAIRAIFSILGGDL